MPRDCKVAIWLQIRTAGQEALVQARRAFEFLDRASQRYRETLTQLNGSLDQTAQALRAYIDYVSIPHR